MVPELRADLARVGKHRILLVTCHGPWLTFSAGVVKGRRLTSFFVPKDDLVNAGALWVDSVVVVDLNLITSRRPDDLPQFCFAVIDVLAKEPQTEAAAVKK